MKRKTEQMKAILRLEVRRVRHGVRTALTTGGAQENDALRNEAEVSHRKAEGNDTVIIAIIDDL